MDIKRKIEIGSAINFWETKESKELGIKKLNFNDGPHGVRATKSSDIIVTDNLLSTCFPTLSLMASTFNVELMKRVGEAIAKEAKLHKVDVLLGPGVNLKRSPLGGRNFEYFSEDGYLTSTMASNYVNAMQKNGIASCLKHFVCNEQEVERMTINCVIDEMTLFETYIKPFKKIIEQSNPASIMSSYNKVNGTKVSENSFLLDDVLRGKLNYDGVVISDWGAVKDPKKGSLATVDFDMPYMGEYQKDEILDGVLNGEIPETLLDNRLKRIKRFSDSITRNDSINVDFMSHNQLAYEVACEGIVLLENDGVLPLNRNDSVKIVNTSVIDQFRVQGAGSSKVSPYINLSLRSELNKLSDLCTFEFIDYSELDRIDENDKVIIFVGLNDLEESEGIDRKKIELKDEYIQMIKDVKEYSKEIIVINNAGTAVGFADAEYKGLLHVGLPGQAGIKAIVDILMGVVNPSGKLSETFPLSTRNMSIVTPLKISQTEVLYSEGTLQGYKYYDYHEIPVKYPFGFGLTYSDIDYSNINFDASNNVFNMTITNKSNLKCSEVLQVYFGYHESGVVHPQKELCAFEKIVLLPDETKTISIKITDDAFEKYDSKIKEYLVKPGMYSLFLGTSLEDILFSTELEIEQSSEYQKHFLSTLNEDSLCKEYLVVESSKVLFEKHFSYLKEMGLYEIILDMPLLLISRLFPKMVLKETIYAFLNELSKN